MYCLDYQTINSRKLQCSVSQARKLFLGPISSFGTSASELWIATLPSLGLLCGGLFKLVVLLAGVLTALVLEVRIRADV